MERGPNAQESFDASFRSHWQFVPASPR